MKRCTDKASRRQMDSHASDYFITNYVLALAGFPKFIVGWRLLDSLKSVLRNKVAQKNPNVDYDYLPLPFKATDTFNPIGNQNPFFWMTLFWEHFYSTQGFLKL